MTRLPCDNGIESLSCLVMKPIKSAFFVAAAALAMALPLAAREKPACMPQVQQGWIRLLPGGMPMHGGFARIENRCPAAVSIVGVSSTSYGSVELHETRNIDGVMRMRELRELRIAPKDAATLKPGGLHLMLMDPKPTVRAGSRVALVFKLSDGREFVGEFVARKPD